MKLKLMNISPDWNTGTVNASFGNAEAEVEGKPAPEMVHVGLMFPMIDATQDKAKARAKELLKAALAALD